jgi:hypothetical protein
MITELNSIKNRGLELKDRMISNRIFVSSLASFLIVFAFSMSSPSSFFQFVMPAMASMDNDLTTGFRISKNLFDDNAGHLMGWNPNGVKTDFEISDGVISTATHDEIYVTSTSSDGCQATQRLVFTSQMLVKCDTPPAENDALNYIVTKLPSQVIGPSSSSYAVATASTFPFAFIR